MGKPLMVGGRAQKYPRIGNRKLFEDNMDAIPRRAPADGTRPGRRTYRMIDGKCVEVDRSELTTLKLMSISVYDALELSGKLKHIGRDRPAA